MDNRRSEMTMLICPRCKQKVLDPRDHGESSLYGSDHAICVPCFFAEEIEQEEKGTNDLPEVLDSYGPSNMSLVNSEIRSW
jgi:hypothetical protein